MSLYRLSKTSRDRMAGVDPRLADICDLAIQITPIDFGIPKDGGVRTAERQQELYLAKKSRCDGYLRRSKHQAGEALDFYAYVNGAASWQPAHLAMIAAAFLQASLMCETKIRWGGLFTPFHPDPFYHGWDCGHIEII